MSFARELDRVLPLDLPHRDRVRDICARHLDLVVEANEHLNLTRIVLPSDAAIKHVLDSVLPWRHFKGAAKILDAGTGAGFPGIPLSLVLPDTQFTLAESTGKKARFVQSVVDALQLENVTIESRRAEDVLLSATFDLITAKAVAPLKRALEYFGPSVRSGARALLYKGPDPEAEMGEAKAAAKKIHVALSVVERYDLPDDLGKRTLVELSGVVPSML